MRLLPLVVAGCALLLSAITAAHAAPLQDLGHCPEWWSKQFIRHTPVDIYPARFADVSMVAGELAIDIYVPNPKSGVDFNDLLPPVWHQVVYLDKKTKLYRRLMNEADQKAWLVVETVPVTATSLLPGSANLLISLDNNSGKVCRQIGTSYPGSKNIGRIAITAQNMPDTRYALSGRDLRLAE